MIKFALKGFTIGFVITLALIAAVSFMYGDFQW